MKKPITLQKGDHRVVTSVPTEASQLKARGYREVRDVRPTPSAPAPVHQNPESK